MNVTHLSRRDFLGGILAASGGIILPTRAFGAEKPNLRLGVVSDIHLSEMWNQEKVLEKALRWFDAQGVDAVLVPGDIAHSGLVREMRSFASVWESVFPKGRGADGRRVERLFVTGNHDLEAHWVKGTDEWRTKNVINHRDNPKRLWRELFGEEFELIWKREVKGYTFIGSQWRSYSTKPDLEAWFREHARELDPRKPFFYTQHAHPRGTCGDGKISMDDGTSTRVLSAYPNAVAITGHSHQTITDDSSVWQGAFTSINAGCLRSGDNDRHGLGIYDSTYPFWHPKKMQNRMKKLAVEEGRCGLLVDVFDDRLLVRRWAFAYDLPLGDDWLITLPATAGSAFAPDRQRREDEGPRFAQGARIVLERHRVTPAEIAGPALKGKPCLWVKIPHPEPTPRGRRVYDFEVELRENGKTKVTRLVLANGFNVPRERANRVTNCLFGLDELPSQGCFEIVATPRTSFGTRGPSLSIKEKV